MFFWPATRRKPFDFSNCHDLHGKLTKFTKFTKPQTDEAAFRVSAAPSLSFFSCIIDCGTLQKLCDTTTQGMHSGRRLRNPVCSGVISGSADSADLPERRLVFRRGGLRFPGKAAAIEEARREGVGAINFASGALGSDAHGIGADGFRRWPESGNFMESPMGRFVADIDF